jgi:hypothetical protein
VKKEKDASLGKKKKNKYIHLKSEEGNREESIFFE